MGRFTTRPALAPGGRGGGPVARRPRGGRAGLAGVRMRADLPPLDPRIEREGPLRARVEEAAGDLAAARAALAEAKRRSARVDGIAELEGRLGK